MLDHMDYSLDCWYHSKCPNEKDNCENKCKRYYQMVMMLTNCGMKNAEKYMKEMIAHPKDKQTFEQLVKLKNTVTQWVPKGVTFSILSNNSCVGKTTWALKMMYRYFEEIWNTNGMVARAYYVYLPEIFPFYSNSTEEWVVSEKYKEFEYAIRKLDLIIWDDITGRKLTPTQQTLISSSIKRRMDNNQSNIITGRNYTIKKLDELIGENLIDLIQQNLKFIITSPKYGGADSKTSILTDILSNEGSTIKHDSCNTGSK